MHKNLFFLCLAAFMHLNQTARAETIDTIQTRPGVSLSYLLLEHREANKIVILFAGGKGALNLQKNNEKPVISWGKKNFLVRSRDLFQQAGSHVIVVDAPSDRQGKNGMLYGFRTSQDHVLDIQALVDHLSKRYQLPIWLVGTSRGTESVAYLAVNKIASIAGIILSASLSEPNRKGTSLTEMQLNNINLPTLVISHQKDGCKTTPPKGSKEIYNQIINSPRKELKLVDGGKSSERKPCKGHSHHGFIGIEEKVIGIMDDFMAK